MKIVGFIFDLLALALAATAIIYGLICGWNCLERLFEVGGTWETAKHAFIVFFSCGICAKVSASIGKALCEYDD